MERDPVIAALVDGFAAEARDICQRITTHVLALEHAADLDEPVRRKHYEDLARGLHTLKGNSDTFGFPLLAGLAHESEDVVQVFRPGLASLPSATTDLLLRAIDVFASRIAARDKPEHESPPLAELSAALARAVVDGRALVPAGPQTRPTRPTIFIPRHRSRSSTTSTSRTRSANGESARSTSTRCCARSSGCASLRLRLDEQRREIERGLGVLQRGRATETADIRDILQSLSRGIDADSDEAGDIVDSLEQEMKAIATLPLRCDPRSAPARCARSLPRHRQGGEARVRGRRDLARPPPARGAQGPARPPGAQRGRSRDRGAERPDRRGQASRRRDHGSRRTHGKPRVHRDRGRRRRHRRQRDSRGRRRARRRDRRRGRGVDDRALHQLLFRAGFSTRSTITELSGRGVGLDVVRGVVQALTGHIEVHTTVGSGTRFVITVPATLGSTPILVVLTLTSICSESRWSRSRRSVRSVPRTFRSGARHPGSSTPVSCCHCSILRRCSVCVLLSRRSRGSRLRGSSRRAVRGSPRVDELIGDRDLVVRPLPPELRDLPAYQGAATQARGDLLLVLQPDFLVEGQAAVSTAHGEIRRALVVDDSLTARALHRTMLESGGYLVHTVGNARQALDHLRHAYYDVVIADIMMADIDGIAAHRRPSARAARPARCRSTRVSSHDTQPERDRGLAAGADAFLSKKDCISGRLLVRGGIGHRAPGAFRLTARRTKVLIAEDSEAMRTTLQTLIDRDPRMRSSAPRSTAARRSRCRSRCAPTSSRWTS